MRTTRIVVFLLFAIVAMVSPYDTLSATPMCEPFDNWVGCDGVPGGEEFCFDAADFCDDKCQQFFAVASVSNTCYAEGPGIYAVSCDCY